MKHICDENGCRLVSDEQYEKYLKNEKLKENNEKKEQKTNKNG